MIERLVAVVQLLAALAAPLVDATLPSVGLLALVAVLTVAIVAVIRIGVATPRHTAVGRRSRGHAVQLAMLPAASHPDAAGHARPRAPGRVHPVV